MSSAADAAADVGSLSAARAALGRQEWSPAFAAATEVSTDSPAEEADRLELLAEAAWWLGRMDECIAAREEAYRRYDELGLDRRAGQCAVWLWEHHAISARSAMAGAWLRRARRSLAGHAYCVEYGALLLREAEAAQGGGDVTQAYDLAIEAVELARRLRSADLEAEALQTCGRILIEQGRLQDGMESLDEAMLFAVEGRLGPYSTGKVYCSLITACEEIGDFARAAEWTEATMQWSERHAFAIFPGICRVHRAIVLKRRGELAEAEVEAARAGEELRHTHVGNSAAAHAELGDICRRLGEFDRAEAAFAAAQDLDGGQCAGLALLRLAQGKVDAARTIVSGCLRTTGGPLTRAGLLPIAVHVLIAAGDMDAAGEFVDEMIEIAERIPIPSIDAARWSTQGRYELATAGRDAVSTLERAVAAWHELRVPYEEATARTLLGEALRTRGDGVSAAEEFLGAARLFDQIGARLDAQSARGDGKPPAAPAGLTNREVEVLRLVAAGHSNREIADGLFLSVKTVSRHLSNIFTKIGVTSRAGATAFAFEQELVGRD
jgi:DNA-binding CsgD family transcriptional regulator